ncbi:MAG TPA: dTDP-4-dehydrorhamnose reductase [Rhodanobacteraceae bacterium]|nr:dTDP-4-dehydrorhamnose reductase [Rhodanobacteraceae bacterium]
MKILVLGATGQVGFELMRALGTPDEIVAAALGGELVDGTQCLDVDFTNPASLAGVLDAVGADTIVNAAAYTAVDRAEDEPDLADRINHRAVAEIGAWAAHHGARVVHYSTDYVFDGAATRPYREDDPTAPLGAYGRTKLAGEDALRASGARHAILRTAWVYGAHGHNFARTMLRLANERDELRIVDDQTGAPTTARLIAATTATVLRAWQTNDAIGGIYHITAAGSCTWRAFAEATVRGGVERGLVAKAPRIEPITTAEFPTRARRPAYSVLDCARLEAAFGLQLPPWQTGLAGVLDELAAARKD